VEWFSASRYLVQFFLSKFRWQNTLRLQVMFKAGLWIGVRIGSRFTGFMDPDPGATKLRENLHFFKNRIRIELKCRAGAGIMSIRIHNPDINIYIKKYPCLLLT
jgi:hypothetical protein